MGDGPEKEHDTRCWKQCAHGVRRGGYLELIDGKFGKHVDQVAEGAEIIDYSGYSIAPGLVDTCIVVYLSILCRTVLF